MDLTITIPDHTKSALKRRARAQGYTDVNRYVERLITTDLLAAKSFDEILAPVRKSFQASHLSEGELESLFEEAREEVHQEKKGRKK